MRSDRSWLHCAAEFARNPSLGNTVQCVPVTATETRCFYRARAQKHQY